MALSFFGFGQRDIGGEPTDTSTPVFELSTTNALPSNVEGDKLNKAVSGSQVAMLKANLNRNVLLKLGLPQARQSLKNMRLLYGNGTEGEIDPGNAWPEGSIKFKRIDQIYKLILSWETTVSKEINTKIDGLSKMLFGEDSALYDPEKMAQRVLASILPTVSNMIEDNRVKISVIVLLFQEYKQVLQGVIGRLIHGRGGGGSSGKRHRKRRRH
jgi:hypothetical protein